MEIGLEYFRDPSEDRLLAMLTQPPRQLRARDAVSDKPMTARSGRFVEPARLGD